MNKIKKKAVPKDRVKKIVDNLLKMVGERDKKMLEWEKEADARISYAKSCLMKIEPFFAMLEPFFAMLLFKLPAFVCYQIPTMGTDGLVLLYNPEFVANKMLRKDIIFILLHEIEHIFLKHNIRGPIRFVNAKKIMEEYSKFKKDGKTDIFVENDIAEMKHILKEWNFAADYVINDHIFNNTKIETSKKLKKTLLLDSKYTDTTSEKVYKDIKTDYDPDAENKQEFDFGIGGIFPVGLGDDLTKGEVAAIEKELEGDVKAAAISARRAGKLPLGVEKVIEDLYTTTTPWQDILRTIFTSINKQDYTFQYPNRRYTMHQVEHGVIMPSLCGEEFVNVGFIMDTSGSVGPREKSILVSELKSILEDYPIKLHVLYCDTKAYTDNVEILTQSDIQNGRLKLNVKGGGGTDMRPAFDYFREKQDEFEFETVICLTDMYLSNWKLGVGLPNADKDVKPPFGICIDIIVDER